MTVTVFSKHWITYDFDILNHSGAVNTVESIAGVYEQNCSGIIIFEYFSNLVNSCFTTTKLSSTQLQVSSCILDVSFQNCCYDLVLVFIIIIINLFIVAIGEVTICTYKN